MIACAAAVTLALSVHRDLQTTAAILTPASISNATVASRREMCIYHAIRRDLPMGGTFYVSGTDVAHFQRLVELATPWALPQPTPATARWLVSVVPGRCYGLALMVRRT